jgi:hypothetical protein
MTARQLGQASAPERASIAGKTNEGPDGDGDDGSGDEDRLSKAPFRLEPAILALGASPQKAPYL